MSAFPEGFNKDIDRHDYRSASLLFNYIFQDPGVLLAGARVLASSIRVAHEAGGKSWEVTMFEDKVRLNVGQVEVLTLYSDEVKFLFNAPLRPPKEGRLDIEDNPYYPAVPVPSGAYLLSTARLPFLSDAVRQAHHAYIRSAASYKQISPWKKMFSPAVIEFVELLLKEALPRPDYLADDEKRCGVQTLPDELDPTISVREGTRYQVTVNAYERNPNARRLCIKKYGTSCCICGLSFRAVYGKVADGLIHVHHLRPLSEIGDEYVVDPVADLRPVCPNCHAVLHRRTPPYSIEEAQLFLRAQTKTSG